MCRWAWAGESLNRLLMMIALRIFLLIAISVSCSASAQLAMKHGMVQRVVQDAIALGDPIKIGQAIIFSPVVIGGLLLYGASAALWLFVLAKLDVSVAYPFVALGFLLTMGL